ncbi:Werner Syndrome-like exonuclease [Bienertia sinuspersici]
MNPQFITTIPHYNPNPTRSQTFTTIFFSTAIHTTVTSTPAIAREWVYSLRQTHRHSLSSSSLVIALGVQWHPSSSSAATLQLCIDNRCLIFQLSHAPAIPATIRRLLLDDRVTFVGVHNGRDRNLLECSDHGIEVEYLVDLAREEGFGNASMEVMARGVLGFYGVRKPREVAMSDWDQFWLSLDQVQYACVDVYVSFLLAQAFGYPRDVDDDEDDDDYDYSDDDEWANYVWGGEYLDYDDYCNPLNYDEFGEYDPDNCNPFNLYYSDFEEDDD